MSRCRCFGASGNHPVWCWCCAWWWPLIPPIDDDAPTDAETAHSDECIWGAAFPSQAQYHMVIGWIWGYRRRKRWWFTKQQRVEVGSSSNNVSKYQTASTIATTCCSSHPANVSKYQTASTIRNSDGSKSVVVLKCKQQSTRVMLVLLSRMRREHS